MNLEITISKTSNGKLDYVQVLSDDQIQVNCVFVVEKVTIKDMRQKK